MKRCLAILMFLALPLAAQEEKKPEPKNAVVQKVLILKYADPNQVASLLRVFNVNIIPNEEMHALAVSATQFSVQAIEEAIQRLDVPSAAPKNIELTVNLVVASQSETSVGQTLPKDLDPVVTQLRASFPFKTYGLKDTLNLRTRTGQGAESSSSGGVVSAGGTMQPIITQFKLRSTSISPDGTIRIDGLKAGSRFPIATSSSQFQYIDLGVNTDLDVKEGQKLVIGRVGISPDQALFLVLTARVVQ